MMNRLDHELFILASFVELAIPNVFKYLNGDDALEYFLEIEEQCVAEFLVYGEVTL